MSTGEQVPALFARYPRLRERLPWVGLGEGPTAVEPLPTPALATGCWLKRDDRTAGAYGGNKVRKLEFLLGEALERGVRRVVTGGAMGSHHALATALHARAVGLGCTAVLFPQPVTDHVREVVAAHAALGTELVHVPHMTLVPPGMWRVRLFRGVDEVMIIPPGGSSDTGTLGYASAALELDDQLRAGALPEPETIHLPAGTLGTAAGLAVGLALAGRQTRVRVVAVRIIGSLVANQRVLRRLVTGTLRRLERAGVTVPPAAEVLSRVEIREGYIGAGYGEATQAGREAAARFGETGISLDSTYTAKAAACFLADATADPGRPRLFWHTLSETTPPPGEASAIASLPPPFRRVVDPA